MNDFLIKNNEIMIFTDFNRTLVDFENEYNFLYNRFDEDVYKKVFNTKANLTKCLRLFEQKTGLVPVICIVTNASMNSIDANNYPGILQDLNMTFFNHSSQDFETANKIYEGSCEKYFRYLIYRENDYFFKINPLENGFDKMFEFHEFPDELKKIRMIDQFKKKESVSRMIELVDPQHKNMPRAIFAGDSIKDDYPMMLADTKQGTSKFFIRPGKVQVMKPSVVFEFCQAKGHSFSSVHPRTGKILKHLDEGNIKFLNDNDRVVYDSISSDGVIYLTKNNSRGLIDGLYMVMNFILCESKNSEKQFQ